MWSGMLRRRAAAVVVATVAVVAALAPSPASAASADELRVLALTNSVRASVGAQPLALDESISAIARRWAATVAAAGHISHNPEVGGVTSGSTALAENVVVGSSIQAGQDALVASPGHYANMVNPVTSQVGIGVVWAGGMVYIVEDFLIVRGATAPTSPPTTARPSTVALPSTATATAPLPTVAPAAPSTTPTPAAASPTAGAGAATAGDPAPSPWLTLSLEVLRDWERASG
jgi:hypothetical protein